MGVSENRLGHRIVTFWSQNGHMHKIWAIIGLKNSEKTVADFLPEWRKANNYKAFGGVPNAPQLDHIIRSELS